MQRISLINRSILLAGGCKISYDSGTYPANSSRDTKPEDPFPEHDDPLCVRLVEMIGMRHVLVKFAAPIDREVCERKWVAFCRLAPLVCPQAL